MSAWFPELVDKSKSTACTVQGCVQKNNVVKGGQNRGFE